jgi:hypothetical protein
MEEECQERKDPGTFLTHLSMISSYLIPKGSPHRSSVPQHGLNGQQQSARINWTNGLIGVHGFLDTPLKETPQVPTNKLVIPQTVLRNPIRRSEQWYIKTVALLYHTFCWHPRSLIDTRPQMCQHLPHNIWTSDRHPQRMGTGKLLNPSS